MQLFRILVLVLAFAFNTVFAQSPVSACDSTFNGKSISSYRFLLSGDLNSEKTPSGKRYSACTFDADYFLRKEKRSQNICRISELKAALGYSKFYDSLWIKNNDNFSYSILWKNRSSKLSRSFGINFKTQLSNSWEYDFDNNNFPVKTWKSGPLLPGEISAGYGIAFSFWKKCVINFSASSLRLTSSPSRDLDMETQFKAIVINNIFIYGAYGIAIRSSIDKMIFTKLKWENTTEFFASGLKKENARLDLKNRLILKLYKWTEISLSTKLSYDHNVSTFLQNRKEIMLGVFWGN